jgi:hypothetical protein
VVVVPAAVVPHGRADVCRNALDARQQVGERFLMQVRMLIEGGIEVVDVGLVVRQ